MLTNRDLSRCIGVGDDNEGWRDGCETCIRKTDIEDGQVYSWIAPPPIIAFECEYLIEKCTS